MAGLRKVKDYDWKDSNLALFGSDTEKKVSLPLLAVSCESGRRTSFTARFIFVAR